MFSIKFELLTPTSVFDHLILAHLVQDDVYLYLTQ